MNSHAHPALASVGSWLYSALAGIRLGDGAASEFALPPLSGGNVSGYGWARIVLAPEYVIHPNLTWASGSVYTPHGAAAVSWAVDAPAGTLCINATVPVSSLAEVRLPGLGPAAPTPALLVTEAASGSGTSAVVWTEGAFSAATAPAGVLGGALCSDGSGRVCLQVAAGYYEFRASQAG